jgi:hypothetical protein
MNREAEDTQHDPTWRPRDRRETATEYDTATTGEREAWTDPGADDERWVKREYRERGDGYNPIGSSYLRDVGITSDDTSRAEPQPVWGKEPWSNAKR